MLEIALLPIIEGSEPVVVYPYKPAASIIVPEVNAIWDAIQQQRK